MPGFALVSEHTAMSTSHAPPLLELCSTRYNFCTAGALAHTLNTVGEESLRSYFSEMERKGMRREGIPSNRKIERWVGKALLRRRYQRGFAELL